LRLNTYVPAKLYPAQAAHPQSSALHFATQLNTF
jgi:hypothetical protein